MGFATRVPCGAPRSRGGPPHPAFLGNIATGAGKITAFPASFAADVEEEDVGVRGEGLGGELKAGFRGIKGKRGLRVHTCTG